MRILDSFKKDVSVILKNIEGITYCCNINGSVCCQLGRIIPMNEEKFGYLHKNRVFLGIFVKSSLQFKSKLS